MKIAGIFKKQDESASSGNRASAEQISEETVNDIIEELSELEDDGVLQMPKPMIANKSAEPETDFTKLSSEEFAKLKQRLAQGR